MTQSTRIGVFNKLVNNKFDIYNSLFLKLPYSKESNIGLLIPILAHLSKQGLDAGQNPRDILETFFQTYAHINNEQEKIDFMFRVIQYVERQVVLFDSVEDAAFADLHRQSNSLSVKELFQLLDRRSEHERIGEKLSTFSARIVFTAHPTQFYPQSVLHIMQTLRAHIGGNNIDQIDMTLQQLGLTSLINSKKPTPLDEAKNIIYFLRYVYYQAIGELYTTIKKSVRRIHFNNTDIIKLGFWPGGDRDGNPFVTAETTRLVADELRMTLMKCYYDDVKILKLKLSFKETENTLNALGNALYNTMFDPEVLMTAGEILQALLAVREAVVDHYHGLYLKDLDLLIDKVNIFKTHFASLDIRQDHSIHYRTVEAVLMQSGHITQSLNELEKPELMKLLLSTSPAIDDELLTDDLVKDTIRNVRQLKEIQQKNGEEGCNRYIISNAEDAFSVLFVFALFRWCGYREEDISFDIIPLFETMEGMSGSSACMTALFAVEEYRKHLIRRGNKQTIMLGFSDGTKDGGYLMANWSIFNTKERLSAICDKNGIKAVFFDGRGGPPARGGGKAHRFYAAHTNAIANHEIQLTIQGQTITSRYGTNEQFRHNCEQLLTAGLSREIHEKENLISAEDRALLDELAQLSYEKYKALKAHPKFIPYLEQKSTLRYYGKTNIGSRPGKRSNKQKLELSDLRAISFVGSWSQLKQNVPGYFGTGTALNTLVNQGKLAGLKKLFNQVPYFKTLILNSMMSLSKSNFALTAYMRDDAQFGGFWKILYDEFMLSQEMLLLISGYKALMEEEPVSRESIKIREKIVLPLLVIQQYALQKIGDEDARKDTYEKIVIRSLYGNINASRNSV
ncbi:MAG: phosphoenolpyruvate carboxylase [Bacteroidetes bacterium]|nr:phosphoenolpyruvate carboxylase [Bacteroidota bacterium]